MNALGRLAALGTFSLVLLMSACGSQTEGERCDQPSDCETGLTCQMIGSQSFGVCCPAPGLSSIASCNPGAVIPDAAAVVDTSTPDAADGGAEDASSEADSTEDGAAE